MKAPISVTWIPGLCLALLMVPAARGLAQSDPNRPQTSASDKTVAVTPEPARPNSAQPTTNSGLPNADQAPAKIQLSPWAAEIVKMSKAGIGEGTLLAYVDAAAGTFNLGADQIIYLNREGVSSEVVTAMLQHDSDVALGLRPLVASTVPASQPTLKIAFGISGDTSGKASKPTATLRTVSASAVVDAQMPDNQTGTLLLEPDRSIVTFESPEPEFPLMDEFGQGEPPAPYPAKIASNEKTYPVREPYPVEITGPILVIQGWSKTPNMLLIQFSP